MEKILIIGEEDKSILLRNKLVESKFEIEISDGDEEEDFKNYDVIFDLNFDDDSENFPIYARLRNKLIFLSSVKQTLSESAYIYPEKVRSRIFGINAIGHYLDSNLWELSAFRMNEWEYAEEFMKKINQDILKVADMVGMYRPRVDFLAINERVKLLFEKQVSLDSPMIQSDFSEIDNIGVTPIFETLIAIYEDLKEIKYLPNTLLKRKYLRNHRFVKA